VKDQVVSFVFSGKELWIAVVTGVVVSKHFKTKKDAIKALKVQVK
jgi:hypothetical protein